MSSESRRNRYRGVNPHLHSTYQNTGGWSGFHSKHIADLAAHIDSQLPAGYEVELEQSLQIREFHPDTGERVRNPRPDVTVYDAEGERKTGQSAYPTATMTQPINETFMLDPSAYYTALRVYHHIEERYPVLQIELLSPGNKPGGRGAVQYIEKRMGILKAGLRLVEVDYLHETPSPIRGLPVYPHDSGAFPYTITVSDPTPSLEDGIAATYGFHVDAPVPMINFPLVGTDSLTIDFDAAYQHTFTSLSTFSRRVDYSALPENFNRYSDDDQIRIREIMKSS